MGIGRKITTLTDPVEVTLVRSKNDYAVYVGGHQVKTTYGDLTVEELRNSLQEAPIILKIAIITLNEIATQEGFTFPQTLGDLLNHEDVLSVGWTT